MAWQRRASLSSPWRPCDKTGRRQWKAKIHHLEDGTRVQNKNWRKGVWRREVFQPSNLLDWWRAMSSETVQDFPGPQTTWYDETWRPTVFSQSEKPKKPSLVQTAASRCAFVGSVHENNGQPIESSQPKWQTHKPFRSPDHDSIFTPRERQSTWYQPVIRTQEPEVHLRCPKSSRKKCHWK